MHDDDLRLAPAHSIFECHPTDVHPYTRRDQSDDNEQNQKISSGLIVVILSQGLEVSFLFNIAD